MGTVIEFPGRRERPNPLPPGMLEEVYLDYFEMRVTQLTPGSPDRLRLERLLQRAATTTSLVGVPPEKP